MVTEVRINTVIPKHPQRKLHLPVYLENSFTGDTEIIQYSNPVLLLCTIQCHVIVFKIADLVITACYCRSKLSLY